MTSGVPPTPSSLSRALAAALDTPVTELLEDLDRIRRNRREAEGAEREARQHRIALEAEENALLGVMMYRRTVSPEPLLERVSNDARYAIGEFSDAGRHWKTSVTADLGRDFVADLVGLSQPTPSGSAPQSPNERSKRPPTRRLVLALMCQRPERETWSPAELHEELVRGGAEGISKGLIRITLRRMAERQEIILTDHGRYGLRPQDRQLAIATSASDGDETPASDMGDA